MFSDIDILMILASENIQTLAKLVPTGHETLLELWRSQVGQGAVLINIWLSGCQLHILEEIRQKINKIDIDV